MAVAEGIRVYTPMDVFGKEAELGKKVVIIGGSMTAVDTALYLADHGHEVTMLTRQRSAGHDYNAHSRGAFQAVLNAQENIRSITSCQTKVIGKGVIEYEVTHGAPEPMRGGPDMPPMPGPMMETPIPKEPPRVEKGTIEFDSVVYSGGKEGLVEECYAFAGKTVEFYLAGDSNLLTFETLIGGPGGGGTKSECGTSIGTIRHALYTGYTAASNL